jgi:hypothetical protein
MSARPTQGTDRSVRTELPTHPDGEFVTYQVQGAGVATIEVFTINRPNLSNCHVKTQTLITR